MAVSQEKGSVRIGPVTLIALVVILCLSVMATLSVTTSRANLTQATRQSQMVASTYANERSGQELLAQVDATLDQVAKAGGTVDGAMTALAQVVPETAVISGNAIHAAYATQTGHQLNISLLINDDLTYTITKWKTTSDWNADEMESATLWTGQ
ncbi:MAG: S4A5 electrogenic sodium bicarbonate cotransporter 4 [Coriobacteriia bacterium]|nr:S4A5 electrogenic sodium bicarbonate cotransporter 4 [Coriobacteriia bacterium]